MAAPPTITQIKEGFVANQVLQLSSSVPLQPSPTFQTANRQSDQALDPRHLQSAIAALEGAIQSHCRRIYAPQANRAVAEQISDTYTKEAEKKLRREGDADDSGDGLPGDGIGKELDLADSNLIASLPTTWLSRRDTTAHPMEAKRYTEAVQTLNALRTQRKELKRRVQRLRHLQSIIDPLKATSSISGDEQADGLTGSVQKNIVTRGGEMEKELERMRMLLVRVIGRVGMLPDQDLTGAEAHKGRELEPSTMTRKRNLETFLADSKVFPQT